VWRLIILLTVAVMLAPAPVALGQVADSGPTIPDPFERVSVGDARPRVVVTVADLVRRDRLEIVPGTEAVWADQHFERVWFPPSSQAPRIERIQGGFRALFERPGTYCGLFTLAGWREGELYRMTIIVKGGTP
jgi:hypothetical protein